MFRLPQLIQGNSADELRMAVLTVRCAFVNVHLRNACSHNVISHDGTMYVRTMRVRSAHIS